MRRLKIMTVCGFGTGTSMILKMKVDEVLKKHDLLNKIEAFPCDVTSAATELCDLCFTSNELSNQLSGVVSSPLIVINNFLDENEIEEKGLEIIKELLSKL